MFTAHDVSVVICAFTEQRWNQLIAAVEAIKCSRTPPGETIVVVDHNAKLLERVRSEITGVVVVSNRHAQNLSGARNSGIETAQGKIVAFVDDDAVPEADWVEWLVAGYEDSTVLGVGGVVEPLWETQRPRWFPQELDWVVGCTYRGLPTSAAPVRNLIGCNMSFRRELFSTVGTFRSKLGRVGDIPMATCDDTEFCIRAIQHHPGHSIWFEPRARVFHNVSARRATFAYFLSRCYGEGQSKALVSRMVGVQAALSQEQRYVRSTLSRAIGRELTGTLLRRDWAGLMRTGAMAVGLGAATAGYLTGWVSKPAITDGTELKPQPAAQSVP